MFPNRQPSVASFLRAATWMWLTMLVGIVLFAAIVSGFLLYLGDRTRGDSNFVLVGEIAALAGALAARWFPNSGFLVRRFDLAHEKHRLDAYRLALIVGLALAEAGALALLVCMLLSQILFPALLFLALPLWSMISMRPSLSAYEAFCRQHR